MKARISKTEWYPVWVLDTIEGYGTEVDIPQDLIDRYQANMKVFDEIQSELRKLRDAPKAGAINE